MKCKHKLFPKLEFNTDIEEDTFNGYLDYKGLFLHKHVYDAFLLYQANVNYKDLSGYIMYDKGIRNLLYKNLSSVEEYYRAKLINNYDINKVLEDPYNSNISKDDLIKTNGETSNLYYYSFSKYFTFSKLINLLDGLRLLNETEKIELNEIKNFRNKVMHHNLIILGYYLNKEKIENQIKEIEHNCELIFKHLPDTMKGPFQSNLNACNHLSKTSRIPNLYILCLGEMKNGIFD